MSPGSGIQDERQGLTRIRGELLPPANPDAWLNAFRTRRVWTSLAAAALGTTAGIISAIMSGRMGDATAAYSSALDLRDAPIIGASGSRSALISSLTADGPLDRLEVLDGAAVPTEQNPPKLILIFDDMGLDRAAFEEILKLPGPVTFSFLPYARSVQSMVDEANGRGDDILLHLPMEPAGKADPGPHSLKTDMSAGELFEALSWNLNQFQGYIGVNNHMGSKFTRDEQMMKRVLSFVDGRGKFFVDSLTTGESATVRAGKAVGAEVYARDVFLDSEPGESNVRSQLMLAEKIAQKTGYAIVICHPRRETLSVIGPWLTTAPARGFELATLSTLRTQTLAVNMSAGR